MLQLRILGIYAVIVNRTDEYDDTYKLLERINERLKTTTIIDLMEKIEDGQNL